eukprot:GHVL01038370.1.p1 GENE.GHVL01038370.1~~GHVL01038370.1.p1  ORF type:complete len:227 (+),score=17.70 GHVL01038370.1:72-752(+)
METSHSCDCQQDVFTAINRLSDMVQSMRTSLDNFVMQRDAIHKQETPSNYLMEFLDNQDDSAKPHEENKIEHSSEDEKTSTMTPTSLSRRNSRYPIVTKKRATSSLLWQRNSTIQTFEEQQKPRWIALPDRRAYWDVACVIIVFVQCVIVPFQLFFFDESPVQLLMSTTFEVFWIIDIIFNFNTAYIEGYVLVSDRRSIGKQYFDNWFLLDTVASVPWTIMSMIIW